MLAYMQAAICSRDGMGRILDSEWQADVSEAQGMECLSAQHIMGS